MSLSGRPLLDAAASTAATAHFTASTMTEKQLLAQIALAVHQLAGGLRQSLNDIDREIEALQRRTP